MGRLCCPKCCEGYHDELDHCPRCGPLKPDCAAYEARIAELTAELARVKSESLRVVPVGEACMPTDCKENFFIVNGEIVCARDCYEDSNTGIWMGWGLESGYIEVPDEDYDAGIQPVRLERWEDAE